MATDQKPKANPMGVLVALLTLALLAVVSLEHTARKLLAEQAASGTVDERHAGLVGPVNSYLHVRYHVLEHWLLYSVIAIAIPAVLFVGLKRYAALANRWRARKAEMQFKQESYAFERVEIDLPGAIAANPAPDGQVFLGVARHGAPVYLTDHVRDTHVHILGQIGSGKTKSVLEPLMFQDLWRGRGVMFLDAKGSQDNEERLSALAASAGRLDQVRIFTLNRSRPTHTYNPLHLVPDADPQAIAERVFSSFEHEMDVPFYRDQARQLFVNLVKALAATGKPFHMLDVAACVADFDVLHHGLDLSSDATAKAEIRGQLNQLGRDATKSFTGLLAAVKRYDHPALNVYAPDIVLERIMDAEGVVGFFLPVNYYKQLARYVGIVVLQHLQQLGALRQLDRSRLQTPLYVYADEFYNFAYEQFITALNMLRDARVCFHIAHQSIADLERVSPEFAAGVMDNCRTKVVLLQTNPEFCERLAKTLATEKGVEKTVRTSADGWLNQVNMLEASNKEVDQYRLHPSRVKMLKTFQAYVTQDAAFVPVNLQLLPALPPATPPAPRREEVAGVGLHRLFVDKGAAGPLAAPVPEVLS